MLLETKRQHTIYAIRDTEIGNESLSPSLHLHLLLFPPHSLDFIPSSSFFLSFLSLSSSLYLQDFLHDAISSFLSLLSTLSSLRLSLYLPSSPLYPFSPPLFFFLSVSLTHSHSLLISFPSSLSSFSLSLSARIPKPLLNVLASKLPQVALQISRLIASRSHKQMEQMQKKRTERSYKTVALLPISDSVPLAKFAELLGIVFYFQNFEY